MRILALDVGNTSVAAALFVRSPASGEPDWTAHRARGASEAELDHWVAQVRAFDAERVPDRVIVGCVHAFGRALAQGLRSAVRASVGLIERGDQFPLATDLREPERIGVDRLAAALAAATLASGPAFVVNAGTAITCDWVDAGREAPHAPLFRGGAIVPGRALQAQALHARTDQLPEIAPWGNPPPLLLPGKSSEEAIRHGLDVSIPAQVAALVAGLAQAAGASRPLFVSGGDAEWMLRRLLPRLPRGVAPRHSPFLVARGLALAAERAA